MGSNKLNDFLNRYVRTFPLPVTGLAVQSIEFRTPYELVVQRALERQFNYSAQDAQQDYSAHPDLVVVRVMISFTAGGKQILSPITGTLINGALTATDDPRDAQSLDSWHGFHFKVAQEKTIEPKRRTSANLTPP